MAVFAPALFELHISRAARERYGLDQTLFATDGRVVMADPQTARVIAERISHTSQAAGEPIPTSASDLYAMALIHEALHVVIHSYRQATGHSLMAGLPQHLEQRLGHARFQEALGRFLDDFPPAAVYRGELSIEQYLAGSTDGISHRERAVEEMLMVWLANDNPAFRPYRHLFDDRQLQIATAYLPAVAATYQFFCLEPGFGPGNEPLMELLLQVARSDPDSLEGQLRFLMRRFGSWLGDVLQQLLGGLDTLREEHAPRFGGPGPAPVIDFSDIADEPENFSADLAWMPNVVLLAKNAHVWLHQLSSKYDRPIGRLDEIPEAEIRRLARWGVSGLWLIGLWERSVASERIKRMCGNPEAVASAYSLNDYRIADDLGGDEALDRLRDMAWRYGIRLASDLVPNHMGIDSRWVLDHPDWFVQRDSCPFPTYSFNGTNLSPRNDVGIYLEDHYYSRTDAAVVFKMVEHTNGRERFIYHGNDGTTMPWNDTAQLNYLRADVREAMIQTILEVARRFPVIRFDAAMTLAKKHYQRLWFPQPGTGGAIPSRAEHAMTRADFDAQLPEEFWREVVDRVAAEAPDTLLLAEAFWLLEGYFVRSLGMHRVYNSAFMNMLRDEDNAKYHSVIRNILEFEPEILKRFVNFMNNPDEDTAVAQFGREDKYFGVCTLMITLPGLPMIGHGQVEGLAEKYGMEYRRPYWDEHPDHGMIARHEREIFPLLQRRPLFSEVQQFVVYEATTPEGHLNHDVYAYSNGRGEERALVLFHNRHADTEITIHRSIPLERAGGQRRDLVDGLGLSPSELAWCVWRDHRTEREHLHRCRDLADHGLRVRLGPYQALVFLDIRQVDDETNVWAEAARHIGPEGTRDVERIVRSVRHAAEVDRLETLLDPDRLQSLVPTSSSMNTTADQPGVDPHHEPDLLVTEISELYTAVLPDETDADDMMVASAEPTHTETAVQEPPAATSASYGDVEHTAPSVTSSDVLERSPATRDALDAEAAPIATAAATAATELLSLLKNASEATQRDAALAHDLLLQIAWCVLRHLPAAGSATRRQLIDEHALDVAVERALLASGGQGADAERAADLVRALVSIEDQMTGDRQAEAVIMALHADPAWQSVCGVNWFEGVAWIDRQQTENALCWLQATLPSPPDAPRATEQPTADEAVAPDAPVELPAEPAERTYRGDITQRILDAGDRCLWRLDRIRGALTDGHSEPQP